MKHVVTKALAAGTILVAGFAATAPAAAAAPPAPAVVADLTWPKGDGEWKPNKDEWLAINPVCKDPVQLAGWLFDNYGHGKGVVGIAKKKLAIAGNLIALKMDPLGTLKELFGEVLQNPVKAIVDKKLAGKPTVGALITFCTADWEKPDVETPDVETPDVETPDVETPDVETPDVETPDVETPDVETPDVETPDVETPDVSAGEGAGVAETPADVDVPADADVEEDGLKARVQAWKDLLK